MLENQTLNISLMCSILFFVSAIVLSYIWRSRLTRGPIELLMRKYTD
ncbi:DUF418 domain-containing protein [Bacillus thuringiensis]